MYDVKSYLDHLVPVDREWRHNDPRYSDCERQNADSHLRGIVPVQSLCLQVRNSAVLLGTWQSIILAELDGPRSRSRIKAAGMSADGPLMARSAALRHENSSARRGGRGRPPRDRGPAPHEGYE